MRVYQNLVENQSSDRAAAAVLMTVGSRDRTAVAGGWSGFWTDNGQVGKVVASKGINLVHVYRAHAQ